MPENPEDIFPKVDNIFAPPLYDNHELEYIKEHIDLHPQAAAEGVTAENMGVERQDFRDVHGKDRAVIETSDEQFAQAVRLKQRTIREALSRFKELEELESAGLMKWVGRPQVKAAIERWQERQRRYKETKNRYGRGQHPEMTVVDGRGRRKYQGVGTDSKRVRRFDLPLYDEEAFMEVDFSADLLPSNGNGQEAPEATLPSELIELENAWGCPIEGCSHSESFNEGSTGGENLAKARLKKHMNNATSAKDDHRAAARLIFG